MKHLPAHKVTESFRTLRAWFAFEATDLAYSNVVYLD